MIVKRFEEAAAQYKNKIALHMDRESLTYGELNRWANRIASKIVTGYTAIDPGKIKNEPTVALLFDHGAGPVLGLLAALKAGKIYVPLDSTYPEKRLLYMLENCGARMILTNTRNMQLAERLSTAMPVDITVINIDPDTHKPGEKLPTGNLDIEETGDRPAYILYTSGSTGRPKGVLQTCANVMFFAENYINALSITSADRLTFVSSFSHDGAVQDIYASLLSGAALYPFDIKTKPISDLTGMLIRHNITLYHSVPTVFRHFAGFLGGDRVFSSLRLIVTGGEPLYQSDIYKVRQYFPGVSLAHMYGQTESSVNTMGFVNLEDDEPDITVGEALQGVELLLLRENGEEVVGYEVGEIFVACSHIAPGYWKDPDTSKKVFLRDDELGRLYRTGDLGRFNHSGNIKFVGRKDNQVKIRGNRVELREIESLLQKYEGIKETVVTAKISGQINNPGKISQQALPGKNSDQVLCAYLVAAKEIPSSQLRDYLAQYLPQYMIPSFFVPIEKIPLTPGGKVDLAALPAPALQKVINYYIRLLRDTYFNGDLEVASTDIDVLTSEGKIGLLSGLQDSETIDGTRGDTAVPLEIPLHRLFEHQVEKTPDKIAVIFNNTSLTYRELNEKANQLAMVLRGRGIQPGTNNVVGVLLEPSIRSIAAVLGILKAGGVYLAMEIGIPPDQVISRLEESRTHFLLTDTEAIKNYSFTDLQGLHRHWRKAGVQPRSTTPRPAITDLDRLPIPDRSLVDYETYNKYIGQSLFKNCITLLASRGCPFNCAYCHKIWPKKQVGRSADNMFSEVRLYYDMGIRRFVFLDDVFNLNVKNTTRFFELIIDHRMDLRLSLCIRGDILTKEYIDLMMEAGTIRIAMALETASPRLQKLIGKNLNLEKLRENLEYICEKYPNVILELNTMHGFPTETRKEAMKTLDFIKSLKWIHFPYVHILKIYQNTAMEKLAIKHGISREVISQSGGLAYHELPDTLPFDRNFTLEYQAEFLNDYFLSKKRLLHVLPLQMKVLSEDEVLQKYNSYLPGDINTFDDLLHVLRITREELAAVDFLEEKSVYVPGLNRKMAEYFPRNHPSPDALRVLFLDLSQFFSKDSEKMLYDVVEAPLGLMYLLTYLKQQFGAKIDGRIAKSRIDFDNYEELKALLTEFKPDAIGIRTLTFYRDFLHQTVEVIRQNCIDIPIIVGGPYGSADYSTILQDRHVDLVVIGEGEVTLAKLVEIIMENDGKLPGEEVLQEIAGIAFVPKQGKQPGSFAREIILLDHHPSHLAHIRVTPSATGTREMVELNPTGLEVSCAFDLSPHQVFSALVQGAVLYVVPGNSKVKGVELLEIYQEPGKGTRGNQPVHIRLRVRDTGVQWEPGKDYTAPRDEIQEKLAVIWADLLLDSDTSAHPLPGIDDNFFQSGGHSLTAAILIARIHQIFDVKIPLAKIFETPTIRSLAAEIKRSDKTAFIRLVKVEEKEYYPLSYHQKRIWFLHRMERRSSTFNIIGIINLNHEVDITLVQKVLNQLVERHECFRTGFKLVEGEVAQFIIKDAAFPFEIIDISSIRENKRPEERNRVIEGLRGISFELDRPPLFRAILVKLDTRHYELLLNIHHIVSDGWSMEIVRDEFQRLYRGYRCDNNCWLEPLELRYKDFSGWQNRHLARGTPRERALQFWKRKLEKGIPTVDISGDFNTRGENRRGAAWEFTIGQELKEKIEKLAKTTNTTLFMVTFTAYLLLILRFSDQEDISCSIINSGREHLSLHRIMGIFVNSIIFHIRMNPEEPFSHLLERVKHDTLELFHHQDYPLELVFDQLKMKYPKIPLSFNMLNMQNLSASQELNFFEANHIDFYQDVKFDMETYLAEFKNGMGIRLAYNRDIYSPETARYMMEEYIKILEFFTLHTGKSYQAYRQSGKTISLWT